MKHNELQQALAELIFNAQKAVCAGQIQEQAYKTECARVQLEGTRAIIASNTKPVVLS
jgi:hypothetical protein